MSAFVSPKILDRAGSTIDPVKIFLTSSLITMQNLVAVYHSVWAHVGGPKNLGMLGAPHPLIWLVWLNPRNMLLPCVAITKFGHSRPNFMGVSRGP